MVALVKVSRTWRVSAESGKVDLGGGDGEGLNTGPTVILQRATFLSAHERLMMNELESGSNEMLTELVRSTKYLKSNRTSTTYNKLKAWHGLPGPELEGGGWRTVYLYWHCH